jgi:outer membrane protein
MRQTIWFSLLLILLPVALLAQAPAPAQPAQQPPAAPVPSQPAQPAAQAPKEAPASGVSAAAGRVAVVDFQKAVVDNSEGKKAQEKFMAEVNKRQKDFEEKQKNLSDLQNKLQTQDKVLGDPAKADLSRQIDKLNTDLQRMNDDAQKDLGDLQQQLFRPIMEQTQKVLQAYSTENGFSVVFDVSSQANSIIYADNVSDITTEIIRRVDATVAKAPAAPAAPATRPPAAGTPAPAPKPAQPPRP